jgi:predicted naringenin-chalcone synthase
MPRGQQDMTWALSSTGFRMTLTSYVTDIIRADFAKLVHRALDQSGCKQEDIHHWCIHPGGKKILDAIDKGLSFGSGHLDHSYAILEQYGNMSSASLLFVLKRILNDPAATGSNCIFGAAFGPGLTMETFLAEPN